MACFRCITEGLSRKLLILLKPALDAQVSTSPIGRMPLGLQLGDGGNEKIKKITISIRTHLAFRYKIYGDFEK